eukprot:CAMPEP_0206039130 /NCGR_PEP_ID=MMETSP1466-20131121/4546_1 /ASSEMBLY_ACC=CAM_ASM_001126 /TAXON_ID=44452 /ORGANISM="Pavlova gyrans, Strain CCMP608" /LENGTH=65 /DNA_ID=CAMNT_0053413749 /DNA_START=55 /DNA_END=252 /DNA_ORIENTATION=-
MTPAQPQRHAPAPRSVSLSMRSPRQSADLRRPATADCSCLARRSRRAPAKLLLVWAQALPSGREF